MVVVVVVGGGGGGGGGGEEMPLTALSPIHFNVEFKDGMGPRLVNDISPSCFLLF